MSERLDHPGYRDPESHNWKRRALKESFAAHERHKDFVEGHRPFAVEYDLPDGKRLEGFQDEGGVAHLVIKEGDDIVLDFGEFLPEGFRFITPMYFEKNPEEEALTDYLMGDMWASDPERKIIKMGEFEFPQDILTLLHELGHANNDTIEELKEMQKIEDEAWELRKEQEEHEEEEKDRAYEILLEEDHVKELSRIERRAWAWALTTVRRLHQERGIDLRGLFSDFEELQDYVNNALGSYRRSYEWIVFEGHDPDFYKELQQLFDKWQYDKRTKRHDRAQQKYLEELDHRSKSGEERGRS